MGFVYRQVTERADSLRAVTIGHQVVLDLYGCGRERLDSVDVVRAALVQTARAAGATIVETVFHKFSPWGVSGVVVIAESHLAIHTWPERGYAAVDIFTCGSSIDLHRATRYLEQAFQAGRAVKKEFLRGSEAA
jgi:S-adenosylmethionine decarboxylase